MIQIKDFYYENKYKHNCNIDNHINDIIENKKKRNTR